MVICKVGLVVDVKKSKYGKINLSSLVSLYTY